MAGTKQHKGDMTVREAGHKGGEKVARERGRESYQEIGHKGGARVRELVDKGREYEGEE
ncbi:MAG: Em GEA1 (EM1) [Myxococcales bacterium]|jgi:general stress protein YciG